MTFLFIFDDSMEFIRIYQKETLTFSCYKTQTSSFAVHSVPITRVFLRVDLFLKPKIRRQSMG